MARNPEYDHHPVYEDEIPIAFLNKYPVLDDCTLGVPKAHRELVTGDFTAEEYLQLQQIIYRVAEPVRLGTGAERVYILSLGSQQGNKHVHWHIAPPPPGVPFEDQQLAALDIDQGILDLTGEEMADLARRISGRIA
ncbi:MAG: HIT domain-containing protein [Thermomicrobiales bacterium]